MVTVNPSIAANFNVGKGNPNFAGAPSAPSGLSQIPGNPNLGGAVSGVINIGSGNPNFGGGIPSLPGGIAGQSPVPLPNIPAIPALPSMGGGGGFTGAIAKVNAKLGAKGAAAAKYFKIAIDVSVTFGLLSGQGTAGIKDKVLAQVKAQATAQIKAQMTKVAQKAGQKMLTKLKPKG